MNYKGHQLNSLPVIAIRLLLWPILMGLGALMTALLALGWGKDVAIMFWREL